MSEGLGDFEETTTYRPGQQIGTMLLKEGKIRLAERVTVKKRVPEPVAQAEPEPGSRPIPTCETCPARVENCHTPGVFQCRLHPTPSGPLPAKHFCFQHPLLAGKMVP